jgi:hypothetical protein
MTPCLVRVAPFIWFPAGKRSPKSRQEWAEWVDYSNDEMEGACQGAQFPGCDDGKAVDVLIANSLYLSCAKETSTLVG